MDSEVAGRVKRFKEAAADMRLANRLGADKLAAERELRGAAYEIVRGDDRPVEVLDYEGDGGDFVGVQFQSGIVVMVML